MERTEKQVQKFNFIRSGIRFDKNHSKKVVGWDIGIYWPHTSQKPIRPNGPWDRRHGRPHNLLHKGRRHLGSGPKSEAWDHERSVLQRVERRQSEELLKLFKKTFIPARNVFHSIAQFFNVKQEEEETLDDYWKKLVDIKRKCEFSRITPEEKARDKFIKGPLELRCELSWKP